MSTEENKATVRRLFEEYSLDVVDELLVPDYTHHDPNLPPEFQHGRDAYKQVVTMFLAAFPDLRTTVEDLIAEGDKVAARWTFRGTHQGELMGIPPTGKQVTGTGMSVTRLANGKMAESWVNFDALGMMQQLGAAPGPGQAAS
jgi:steroid delta-isomerase-like uncharacterized protein